MSAPPPQGPANDQQARRARHLHLLDELIGMGMDMARALHAQATAPAGPCPGAGAGAPEPQPGLAAAFDRIARTVRRTVLLSEHVAGAPAHGTSPHARTEARARIIRTVEDRIGHVAVLKPRLDAPALRREMLDRLDTEELDHAIAGRPIPEIIEELCADLGLTGEAGYTPHQRRTQADIARLLARAAAPPGTIRTVRDG